jgi:CTP:molybdopterin cytidylyltransferase MocA
VVEHHRRDTIGPVSAPVVPAAVRRSFMEETPEGGSVSPIAGIVLAAGGGRRFGGPKAVAEVGGERLVDRAVRVLREGGCAPVVAVLGAAVVPVPGADVVVVNPDWAAGMGSSLRAGLAAEALGTAVAAVVVLADQPWLSPAAIRAVARDVDASSLVTAVYGGERGHPVLLGRDHWAGVRELARADVGARAYLAAHAADVVAVEVEGSAADVDRPEDLPR